MSALRVLDALDDALSIGGWTLERSDQIGADTPRRTWRRGRLVIWAAHLRGVGSYVIAESDGPGRWAWRVEIDGDEHALLAVAEAAHDLEPGDHPPLPNPGPVFGELVRAGWTIECGPDSEEASMRVVSPDGWTTVTDYPDSPVDPGRWTVRSDRGEHVASARTPWRVVLALAGS